MEIIHTPVLLQPCLQLLSPEGEPFEKNPWMVDSTLGEGGHSNAFLSHFPSLSVIGIDADSVIQERAKLRISGMLHMTVSIGSCADCLCLKGFLRVG